MRPIPSLQALAAAGLSPTGRQPRQPEFRHFARPGRSRTPTPEAVRTEPPSPVATLDFVSLEARVLAQLGITSTVDTVRVFYGVAPQR